MGRTGLLLTAIQAIAVVGTAGGCGEAPYVVVGGDDSPAPDAALICRTCVETASCSPEETPPCVCPAGAIGDGTVDGTGCVVPDAAPGPCGSAGCGLAGCRELADQAGTTCEVLYAGSTHEAVVWVIDPSRLATRGVMQLGWAEEGPAVRGLSALTTEPATGQVFAVVRLLGQASDLQRLLVTVTFAPGHATLHLVGNLGDKVSSLAFTPDGRLFGMTGDGTVPGETLVSIDPATAAVTPLRHLGAGGDGEALAYDPASARLMHWSGDALLAVETVAPVPPYAVTPRWDDSPAPAGETFGAIALDDGWLLSTTSGQRYVRWRADGTAVIEQDAVTNGGYRGLARGEVASGELSLTPTDVPLAGGAVTLRGTFVVDDVVGVEVGGVPAALLSANPDALTFEAPARAAGPAAVVVQTASAGPLDGGVLTYGE